MRKRSCRDVGEEIVEVQRNRVGRNGWRDMLEEEIVCTVEGVRNRSC